MTNDLKMYRLRQMVWLALMLVSAATAQSNPSVAPDNGVIAKLHDAAKAIAAVGLLVMASYSGYKHMFAMEPLEKKDAWETLKYALVGVALVLLADPVGNMLMGGGVSDAVACDPFAVN